MWECDDITRINDLTIESHPYLYAQVLTHEQEDQLWTAARNLAKRNQDSLEPVEGILNLYVQRYLQKEKCYDPALGSKEQFLGLVVSNVNSRLTMRLAREQRQRRESVWIDEALTLHGEQVTSDKIFQETVEARLMREQLAADVRDTLAELDPEDAEIGETFLRVGGVNATAQALGMAVPTFKLGPWPRFKEQFKQHWERDGFCKNFTK